MLGKNFKALTKAVTWRLLGAADTFVLAWVVTGKPTAAVGLVGFELVTKTALYWGHERAWDMPWVAKFFAPATAKTA